MNRLFIVAVLTVTMIIMMTTAGFAIEEPHNQVCDNCHGKFLGNARNNPSYADNACLTCHSSNGEASRMPVNAGDIANYFGSQPVPGTRSSHTVGTVSPYAAAAKIQEPINGTLNTSAYIVPIATGIYCVRCHDAKNGLPGEGQRFLRVVNTNDALCLDCHRSRKTATSTTGTHPVTISYSSVYKSNTTAFRKKPLAGNINNPTSNPGNYLVGGKIVCSTCHAPHYADSNSSTFGNRTTANGSGLDDAAKGLKGQLQSSKGTLLRTDAIATSSSAINACSSCHKETANRNHDGKGQNIQCDHCHGAHVDYTGDNSLPNRHLVRRDFSGMSTAKVKLGANVKVIYNSATTQNQMFKRSDSKGICQVCHTPTPGVAIHDVADGKAADCIVCHKHSNGFSAADCTSCHGQPPVSPLVGGPNGKSSSDYTVDEALTPHSVHATSGYYNYACKNCHYNGTPSQHHNTKSSTGTATFQSVFVDTVGSVGSTAGHANIATDYNSTTRVCSNVYCHSNGDPRNGTFTPVATPSWQYGKNKIVGTATECSSCHGYGVTLTTNAHQKHIASGLKCAVCHTATVNSAGQITDRTKHANGAKDVVFIARPDNYVGAFTAAAYNSSTATCANSCHSNGAGVAANPAPVWTTASTGACGTCHAAVATTTLHPFHFNAANGPLLGASPDCSNCHDYALGNGKHANGVTDLKPGNTCSPCHPATTGTPVWMVGAKVTCESCHVGTASVITNGSGTFTAPLKSLSAGHSLYSTAITKHVVCTTCHDDSKAHIGAGAAEKRLKLAGNALCNDCHTSSKTIITNTARIDLPTHMNQFTKYTSAANLANIAALRADACAGCHDTHGTTNNLSVRTVINGLSVTYVGASPQFIDQTPDGNGLYHGLCQVCHTKTKYFNKNSAPALPSAHAQSGCLGCHKHNGENVKYAFQPGGGCNSCHGYPPVKNMTGLGVSGNYTTAKIENYAGGGGAHSVPGHISKAAFANQGWNNCTNCHSSTGHPTSATPVQTNVNVTVDAKFKFNSASPITYSANTCSNVSCHFRPSPNWTTGQ